jgi:uncharacterized protein YlzI (FlbEa/FlbD family)
MIKLTSAFDGKSVWINAANIDSMMRHENACKGEGSDTFNKGLTKIFLVGDNGGCRHMVEESPEEIVDKINRARASAELKGESYAD